MYFVRTGGRHNADLPSSPFPILGAIGMFEHVVFSNRFHSKQLPTRPGWRNKLTGGVSPNPVDSVDQKSIGFLPFAGDGEAGPTVPLSDIRSVIRNADV